MDGLTHEESLVRRHRRNGVLLDANLLLLYEIGRYSEPALKTFPHTKQYAIGDYRLLARLIGLFSSVLTTPNILTEVSNLAGKLHDAGLREFRTNLQGAIGTMSERYCASKLAAASPAFVKFGLTDAGIAALCENQFLVLTDDLALAHWLASKKVDVLNFNHIRQMAWSMPRW